TSVVRLVDPNDVIEKMTYALTNPVKDGLVEKAHHWPGVSSLASIIHGRSLAASRPKHFFREESTMPETVELSFARPRQYDHLSPAEFSALVTDRIRQVEESIAVERRRDGTTVIGRKAVLRQAWSDRPASREPRRGLVPRIAARNKWSRIE